MAGSPKLRRNGRLDTDAPFRLRPATAADVDALVAIERAVFSDPWSRTDFRLATKAGPPDGVNGFQAPKPRSRAVTGGNWPTPERFSRPATG